MDTTQKTIKALAVVWNSANRDRRRKALLLLNNFLDRMDNRKIYPLRFGDHFLDFITTQPKDPIQDFEFTDIARLISSAVKVANHADADNIIELVDVISLFTAISRLFFIYFNIGNGFQPTGSLISKVLFQTLIQRIGPERLHKVISVPLASAIHSYQPSHINGDYTYTAFLDEISNFYEHVMISTNKLSPKEEIMDKCFLRAEAMTVLNDAFEDEGGHKHAFLIAKDNIKGGIGTVFQRIVLQIEKSDRQKLIRQTWLELCPFDWSTRVALVEELMKQVKPCLSETVAKQPPAMFADNIEPVIDGFIRSMEPVKNLMKSF